MGNSLQLTGGYLWGWGGFLGVICGWDEFG